MRESWNVLTPAARLACLAAVVATAAGIAWSQRPTAQPDRLVDLLETRLSPAEAAQVRLALVQKGIEGFRIDEGRLMVPIAEQAACLQTLVEANALPEALLDAGAEDLPAINPFQSQSHQQLVQQQHRARQIRRLLCELPFVSEATVQLDCQPAASMYAAPDLRCVASIRPHGCLVLNADELATIRENLLAAIAGVEAGRIVINDLNSGVAWNAAKLPATSTPTVALEQLQRVRHCEHRLGLALAAWPGIDCRVVESVAANRSTPLVSAGAAASPKDPAGDSSSGVSPGANSRIRVPVILPGHARELLGENRKAQLASAQVRQTPLAIELTVTEEGIDHYLEKHAGPGERLNRELPGVSSEAERAGLKKELLESLDKSWRQSGDEPLPVVEVRFATPAANPLAAVSPQPVGWNGWRAGTVWALGSGLVLCGLLTVTMRRRRLKATCLESESAARPDVWFDNSSDTANRDRIRRQIDDLIDRNPEAAAKVIQTWIRDAA